MRPNIKTFLRVCTLCLITLLCFSWYLLFSKDRHGILSRTLISNKQDSREENDGEMTNFITKRKLTQKRGTYKKHGRRNQLAKIKEDNKVNIKSVQANFKHVTNKNYNRKKYLIYLCKRSSSCSGWADRQRAIISAFLLAERSNRTFGIILTSPCDFIKFYIPNKYNWAVNESDLTNMTIAYTTDIFLRNIASLDFNKQYPEDLIYLRTHRDLFQRIRDNFHLPKPTPRWAKFNKPDSFRNGWNLLMKRSHQFDRKFRNITSGLTENDKMICAHVRLRKNPTIPMDGKSINSLDSVGKLWIFLDIHYPNASRIFVATDSTDVRMWARRHFKEREIDTGQTILHVEKQKRLKTACEGFESVLLDQAVLAQCSVLVCSNSNLCKQAAYIGGLRKNVFMFNNGKVYPFQIK